VTDGYIVHVEDSSDDSALTQVALARANINNRVVALKDGVEALDFIFGRGEFANRNANELPAFILLDLKLPKVDGFDVLRRLREDISTAHIPVVVFTSSREEQDIETASRLGANSYVRKPVDFDDFIDAVRQIGRYWLFMNESPRPWRIVRSNNELRS
jgi:two-component system response regulator